MKSDDRPIKKRIRRQKFQPGDLIRTVDDPNSFIIGELLADKVGVILEYDEEKKIYTVLLENGTKFRTLDFMLEKVKL